jgi:hypothetical protein
MAVALAAALLAKSPLDVFSIDESLSLAAFNGLSRMLLAGDLGGDTSPVAGFDTEIGRLANSVALDGEGMTVVELDLM